MTIMRIAAAGLATLMIAQGAAAQSGPDREMPDVPGQMPGNLNELGSEMKDRAGEIILGEEDAEEEVEALDPTLYAGPAEDPEALREIRAIARDLDTRLSSLEQMDEMQRELIRFARLDPAAAHASRPSAEICENALDTRFCDRLSASFRSTEGSTDASGLMIVPVE